MDPKKKLATGVYRMRDGRLWLLARYRNRKAERSLPASTLLSVAVSEREAMLGALRNDDHAGPASLTCTGAVLRLYNGSRTWGDDVYASLIDRLNGRPVRSAWEALEELVEEMESGTTPRGTPYTPATINRRIAMAKAAFSMAYKRRLIDSNILAGFPLKAEDNRRYRILSGDERQRLYDALPEYLRPIFYFACRVPCRVGELVNLRREHYNSFRGLIVLEDGTTKNGEGRWLPVPEEMEGYFRSIPSGSEWLFYRRDESETYHPLGYWSEDEKKVVPSFKKAWYSACASANVADYNFHKTRQQAAMQLLYDGWREIEVMMVGGWKSHAAFRRYVHADEVMLLKRLGKWEEDASWKKEMAPKTAVA